MKKSYYFAAIIFVLFAVGCVHIIIWPDRWLTAIAFWLAAVMLIPALTKILKNTRRMEVLVTLRTKELQEANKALLFQIEQKNLIGQELAYRVREIVELQRTTVETLAILDSLMQLAPLGIAFLDNEGRYVRINNWLAQRNGYSVSDHTGRHYKDILPTEMSEDIKYIFSEVVSKKQPIINIERDFAIGNKYCSWQFSFYPVSTPDGRTLGVGVVIADITSIRHQSCELKDRDERLTQATKAGNVGTWRLDLRTKHITTDQSCNRILNCISQDSIKPLEDFYQFIHPDDRVKVIASVDEAIRVNGAYDIDCRIVTLYNDIRWVSNRGRVICDDRGNPVYLTGVLIDSTQRKNIETELKERVKELVAEDKKKTEFLAMLAHELRNPLAPIMNSVYLLQTAPETNMQTSIVMIHRQIKHMARLLDDLLDVARLNRGKITLRKEPIDIRQAVRNAVENNKDACETRKHKLEVSISENAVLVSADFIRLEQICNNLISNAVKYTESGGTIAIKLEIKDGWAIFSVKDSGIGISPEMLPNLFKFFAQASRSLDRSQGGLGIGLALAQDLTRMHGGTIHAYSEGVGCGSEFMVQLPLLTQGAKIRSAFPSMKKRKFKKALKPMNILVVDDNQDSANSLAALLRLDGHEAQMVYDGATALRKLPTYKPDVVILDVGLPGLDGYTVCELLRESGYDGLVIAVTGYGTEDDQRRAEQAGFNFHLTKPVEPEDIEILINQYAERKIV
jgi:PAS domain S-box-containing protein